MRTVSQSYLKSLLKYVADKGLAPSDLPATAEKGRISLLEQDKVWKYLNDYAEPLFGFEFGCRLSAADLGVFGHLLMSAATLDEALTFLRDYYPIVGDGGIISIESTQADCIINYQPLYKDARALRIEAVMACLMSLGHKLTSATFSIKSLSLDYQPESSVLESFVNLGDCDIQVNQKQIQLVIPKAMMHQAFEYADSSVVDSLLPSVIEQFSQLEHVPVAQKAAHLINLEPTMTRAQLAQKMGLSERSCCRYLKTSGTSFAILKQEVCLRQSEQMISNNLPIERIAEVLGYSDASAFIKAFKGWTGITPGQFKRRTVSSRNA
ncbi:AraC family transcriptional regulator [Alteromonadaceae bacterium M269]|nr:AraC family transcriptional regulator [Alteromonadaceae bacterium M269]